MIQKYFTQDEEKDIQHRIFVERIRILHQQLMYSLPAYVICCSLILANLWAAPKFFWVIAWYLSTLFIAIARFFLFLWYQYNPSHLKRHYTLFIVGTLLSAISLGIVNSIFMSGIDFVHQVIIIIIVAGVVSGGLQTLQASARLSIALVVIAVLPLMIWAVLQSDKVYFILGLAILSYMFFMIMIAKRGYEQLIEALRLRFQNLALIQSLEKSNKALEKAQVKLTYFASHDHLTQLPNRKEIDHLFSQLLNHAARHGEKIAVMFLDLDHFKEINDKFGHDVGDELLTIIGKKLAKNMRGDDKVARMGGDEFLILLPDVADKADTEQLIQRILLLFSQPFILRNQAFSITISIGISIYPDDGKDKITLLKHADMALYEAKKQGRNKYIFYHDNSQN